MTRLLIVYHTRTGGSRQMAEAAYNAAKEECETQLQKASETSPDDMLSADGYLFVAPENLASLSGEMKEFFDRCYYPLLGKIEAPPHPPPVFAGPPGGKTRPPAGVLTSRHRP
ncbi:MAG: hypothetical protein CMK04_00530 [Ponticaulis sp.]|nr:NAD(P)H-dependent oxidoreductase [Ponticaulis sp.]MAJ07321.1 hypothetical protein [Ponticaulis sp.]